MEYNTEVNIYDSYRENSLIPTSYIRDYGDNNPLVETPLPQQNYTAYDLFTLKSRLEPHLYNILHDVDGWYVKFLTLPSAAGMRVYLHILDSKSDRGAKLTLNQKNNIINAIDKESISFKSYCLIFDPDTVDLSAYRNINRSWIRTIIPYLNITSKYKYDYNNNPLNINDTTMNIIRMGYKIYINLETSPNCIQHWAQLQQDILKRLSYLYDIGATVMDTTVCLHNIILDWKLKPLYNNIPEYESKEVVFNSYSDKNVNKSAATYVDVIHMEGGDKPLPSTNIKGIYVPDWYDTRLSPMADFINRVMFGDKTLKLEIEEKLTAYHSIATKLNMKNIVFSFVRGMIIVNVDNYKQTISCLDDICTALANQPDTVIQLDPKGNTNNIIDKAHGLGFTDTAIYYLSPYGHMLSIGLTINHDQNEVYRLLREE